MKLILLTILLLATVSAQAPTPSKFAENFEHYASTPTTGYYLNEKDVIWKGPIVTFYGVAITSDRITLTKFTADCDTFEYQGTGRTAYKGKVTDFSSVREPAPQGSIIYAVLNRICGVRI